MTYPCCSSGPLDLALALDCNLVVESQRDYQKAELAVVIPGDFVEQIHAAEIHLAALHSCPRIDSFDSFRIPALDLVQRLERRQIVPKYRRLISSQVELLHLAAQEQVALLLSVSPQR